MKMGAITLIILIHKKARQIFNYKNAPLHNENKTYFNSL